MTSVIEMQFVRSGEFSHKYNIDTACNYCMVIPNTHGMTVAVSLYVMKTHMNLPKI